MKKLITIIASFFLTTTSIQAQQIQQPQSNGEYLIKPSGKYSVSYHDFFWINGNLNNVNQYNCPHNPDPFYTGQNKNDFSPNNQTDFCREVVVRVYYPTEKNNYIGQYYAPLIQSDTNAINSLPNDQYPSDVKKKLINELSVLKSYTVADEKMIPHKKFPVLFFSPGYGCNVEMYENFMTHLVSHGYIVVAINSVFISGYVSLENSHIVLSNNEIPLTPEGLIKARQILVKDAEFVYNKISSLSQSVNNNKIDDTIFSAVNLKNMGIFGHSVGGELTGDTVLAHPSWFKAAATFDSGEDSEPNRPTKNVYPIPVLHQTAAYGRYLCAHSPNICENDPWTFNLSSDGFLVVHQIDESKENMTYSDHMNFTDDSTLQYQHSFNELTQFQNAQIPAPGFTINSFLGAANGWELTRNINEYLLKFFNTFLKGYDLDGSFKYCKPMTKHAKLICGPASDV